MNSVSMNPRDLVFLLSESEGTRSRATGTIASGAGKLSPGTLLGEVTATGELVPSPDAEVAGLEGAEIVTAILAYAVDATVQAVDVAIIDRSAEVKASMLIFDASVDDQSKIDAKTAQLNALGIRVR